MAKKKLTKKAVSKTVKEKGYVMPHGYEVKKAAKKTAKKKK